MQRYRRSKYLIFTLEDLPGPSESGTSTKWVATAVLSGHHLLVNLEQMAKLQAVSCTSWTGSDELETRGFSQDWLEELAGLAVFLTDSEDRSHGISRDREQQLDSGNWPPLAAAFHLLNHHQESRNIPFGRVTDTNVLENAAKVRALRFVTEHGPPPPAHFVHPATGKPLKLPRVSEQSHLDVTFLKRRTCRHFDPEATLSSPVLSRLLWIVFGPVAVRTVDSQLQLLLKTSPSGGSLHPIEAFPLVFRCDGLESGLYHYRTDLHGLAPMRALPESTARQLAVYFAQGQSFVGTCSAVIVLVIRFERNFWKYRRRENSYAVMLQDAGHLSQTFQLAATDLGLASFYTAALNGEALADFLELRYPAESAVGILGVGLKDPKISLEAGLEGFEPSFQGL